LQRWEKAGQSLYLPFVLLGGLAKASQAGAAFPPAGGKAAAGA
jgi:hypothetical protein